MCLSSFSNLFDFWGACLKWENQHNRKHIEIRMEYKNISDEMEKEQNGPEQTGQENINQDNR